MWDRRRGQSSVELLVILSVVIVIIALMGIFLYQKYIRGDEMKIFVHGNRVVNTIAENINEINMVGSGYSQYFTLPEALYGSRNYRISFVQNEPAVYIHGGSFVRGVELTWSSPLSTIRVGCVRSECNVGCNKTAYDICLRVNDSMVIRATNENGVVYLAYPYNIKQGDREDYISPVRGNVSYTNESCLRGSFVYVQKNTLDKTVNLVFQHNSSADQEVKMDFYDLMGQINVTRSDEPNELNLNSSGLKADWQIKADECSGGVVSFNESIHLCIDPDMQGNVEWFWLNGDGTTIVLNKSQDLCLSYP